MITLERCRHDDEESVGILRLGVGMQGATGSDLLQEFLHTRFDDVQHTCIRHLHDFFVHINTYDFYAMLGCNYCGWEANVAQSHETCFHFLRINYYIL